ncbi:MAG: ABC transporter ATP-binding protein [Bacteriovoracia bacterium]
MPTSAAIEIENVIKEYKISTLTKKRALDYVSLKINPGEIFGFLGPNGAGKTTLIKILVGLLKPDTGSVRVAGLSSEYQHKIGYLPENTFFHSFLTTKEFLTFHGRLLGMDLDQIRKKVSQVLRLVGLEKTEEQRLSTFSKGMLQRVGIAQSLIHDPEILILDEPMSGLDPVGRREIRDIINTLAEKGKTVFFSTHIIHDVEVICTTVGFIQKGQLKGAGNIEELLGKTAKSMEIRFSLSFQMPNAKKTMDGWVLDVEDHADRLENSVNKILAEILKNKGSIRSVIPRKNTLEDLFFSTK